MSSRSILQIAYADDHHIVRRGISDFIQNLEGGFNVYIQARDGQELLDKIAAASYQPDVCILDISMPKMNGYETMLQLRRRYPYIRALALTALDFSTEYPVLKMLQNGAGGYLCKSCDPDEIGKALIDIYTTGYYFSEEILAKFPKMNEKNMKEYFKKIFTETERTFLAWCCSGLTYKEIGDKMHLSQRTIESYATDLGKRIGLESKLPQVELAMYALKAGIGSFQGISAKRISRKGAKARFSV